MTVNLLLVEGDEDKRILPELLERAGVPWGKRGNEIVKIHSIDGVSNFTRNELRAQLKTSGLTRLGVILDADDGPGDRWAQIRSVVDGSFDVPPLPVPGGLVVPATGSMPRFGVWLMPDNSSKGMMESFLLTLCPDSEPTFLAHVESSTDVAASLRHEAAVYGPAHRDKALIHTWLAWRDPPGSQLHQALKSKVLDPSGPLAAQFVCWFRDRYELPSSAP